MDITPERILLDTPAAARYLAERGVKLTAATLTTWRSTRMGLALPFRRIGNRIYYVPADLDRLVAGELPRESKSA